MIKKKIISGLLLISFILPNIAFTYSYADEYQEIKKIKREVQKESAKKEKVSDQMDKNVDLDKDHGKSVANQVSKYKLDENFEYAVKKVLNYYYENDEDKKIEQFKEEIDQRADQIIEDFEKAKEERDTEASELNYEAGKILVEFEDNIDEKLQDKVVENLDGKIANSKEENMGVIEISKGETVEKALENYENHDCIKSVQPNYTYRLQVSNKKHRTANDTYAERQYYLDKLKIYDAWDYLDTIKTSKVKVAVIDTGVDTTHDDLQSNLVISKDAINEFSDLKDDLSYHGTHVCGIIGATTNNSSGIASAANNKIDLISINIFRKVSSYDGFDEYLTYTEDMIRGYKYAVESGASVINMSLGRLIDENAYGDYDKQLDSMLNKEIEAAAKKGIVTVCAAGNNNSNSKFYPADYESCISVINIDENDQKAWDSNYGYNKDISAYGVGIYSTVPESRDESKYSYEDGTSMASPIVASVVALMKSKKPNATVEEIKNILYETADDIGVYGKDIYTGYGRINALAAVKAVKVKMPKGVTVNFVDDSRTKVEGTAFKYSTIKVYDQNKNVIGTGKANSNGKYSVTIPKQPGGTIIKVSATKTGYYQKSAVRKVLKTFKSRLTAKNIKAKSTSITGTGEKSATVKAYVNGKEIGTATVNKSGKYTIKIPKQKKKTIVKIRMTKNGYTPKTINRRVL